MVGPPQPGAAEKKAQQRVPREIILIADTSGSMQGASMEQAKQALLYALGTLTERDRFNVVEFNSVTHHLFDDAVAAIPANLQRAREWVGKLKAGGGTEMAPALTFALNGHETPGVLRQVVFMTDGGGGDEKELFNLIVQPLRASRPVIGGQRRGRQGAASGQGRGRPRSWTGSGAARGSRRFGRKW